MFTWYYLQLGFWTLCCKTSAGRRETREDSESWVQSSSTMRNMEAFCHRNSDSRQHYCIHINSSVFIARTLGTFSEQEAMRGAWKIIVPSNVGQSLFANMSSPDPSWDPSTVKCRAAWFSFKPLATSAATFARIDKWGKVMHFMNSMPVGVLT